MPWDGVVRLRTTTLGQLAKLYGGEVRPGGDRQELGRFVPVTEAGPGDLAPVLARRFVRAAVEAHGRGARLLVDQSLAPHPDLTRLRGWIHPHAAWAMAEVLATLADVPDLEPTFGEGIVQGAYVTMGKRVVVGNRVHIGASCMIGAPGFGWATAPDGTARAVPQLGGVVIEDDVHLGPACTVACGTLSPTIIRRGVKIDAQVHIGHNCDIGEGTMIAAQSGFAGSVKLGRRVMVGGQVGVGDHVTIGDGARIAGGSGVIGDIPPGAVVAGYPAVPRGRWLRGLAWLYRGMRPHP